MYMYGCGGVWPGCMCREKDCPTTIKTTSARLQVLFSLVQFVVVSRRHHTDWRPSLLLSLLSLLSLLLLLSFIPDWIRLTLSLSLSLSRSAWFTHTLYSVLSVDGSIDTHAQTRIFSLSLLSSQFRLLLVDWFIAICQTRSCWIRIMWWNKRVEPMRTRSLALMERAGCGIVTPSRRREDGRGIP